MKNVIENIQNYFFIGIAGDGMSAIAQYLVGTGKKVYGSDRQFSVKKKIKRQILLENSGIKCYPQDTSAFENDIDLVIISSAIEPSIPEYKLALEKNIQVIMRSDLLAEISKTKKTIAVAGTSGKSTVAAMIFHIMEYKEYNPGLITGAGLISLQEKGLIGNAVTGSGEYLIIEADESDGSIVKYHPEIGIILNIDKDHKELDELETLFSTFKENSKIVVVNNDHSKTKRLSQVKENNFGDNNCGYLISKFTKESFKVSFFINEIEYKLNQIGRHNAENAAAAVAACNLAGISVVDSANALRTFKGIYRRHQILYNKNGLTIIDDYAHNPAKLAASIKACQIEGKRLIVWFQPHGYKPTRFLRKEFVKEISCALRKDDEIWMSEIYYAGGTVQKDISSLDLINDISRKGKKAFYIESRDKFPEMIKAKISSEFIILLTGARDPSLKEFSYFVKDELKNRK